MHIICYRTRFTALLLAVVFTLLPAVMRSQEAVDGISPLRQPADSLSKPAENKSGLTAVVNYKAKDSLVFSMGNLAWLYGESEVTYDDINLTAERIQMSLDSSLVHANGVRDTSSENPKALIGAPVFKDKSGEYETRTISYNFKTAKGYITDVVTEQGDGYVTGGVTKKMPDNDIFLENGHYTTCDYTECPHFYINLTKARVRPGKNIVTGPAYLVVADVPLPVAIPFGFFPFTKSYSSGIIMPTYGSDMKRGLYLNNGGYYFAINDYMDLSLTGQLYTKGTWGLKWAQKYNVRYKFNGNYSIEYLYNVSGEKGMPDYAVQKDFKVKWSHSQDSRYNPNLTVSANVDYSTTGYDRNNIQAYGNQEQTNSQKSSSVSLNYKVPNSKWTISSQASISQSMKDSTLAVSFPTMTISMSSTRPFKRKVKVGAERWYEKIAMTYNANVKNSIRTKQDQFMHSSLVKDWNNGVNHAMNINANYKLFNYITVTPSLSVNDYMYTRSVEQTWDETLPDGKGGLGAVRNDTTYGFRNSFDYRASLGFSTTLYGMYVPLPALFKNSKLVAVRHKLDPTISISYNPDSHNRMFGAWDSYWRPVSGSETNEWEEIEYNRYNGFPNGSPTSRMAGAINFGLDNNIEAKIRSDKDSTGFRKISIIDKLSTSMSYNMAADSMKWSETSNVSLVIKPSKNNTMNLSGTFDNYEYGKNKAGTGLQHIDRMRIAHGKLPRLMRTGYSYSYQLNNKKVAGWFGYGDEENGGGSNDELEDDGFEEIDPTQDLDDPVYKREKEREREAKSKKRFKNKGGYDDNGYLFWEIPWTLSLSYRMDYAYNSSDIDWKRMEYNRHITHSLSFSGSINPTKNWDFRFNATYDFDLKKIGYLNLTMSRDMHCWTMNASLSPLGRNAYFTVCVAVKSQMLSDLKYQKSSVSGSNKIDWYDE